VSRYARLPPLSLLERNIDIDQVFGPLEKSFESWRHAFWRRLLLTIAAIHSVNDDPLELGQGSEKRKILYSTDRRQPPERIRRKQQTLTSSLPKWRRTSVLREKSFGRKSSRSSLKLLSARPKDSHSSCLITAALVSTKLGVRLALSVSYAGQTRYLILVRPGRIALIALADPERYSSSGQASAGKGVFKCPWMYSRRNFFCSLRNG